MEYVTGLLTKASSLQSEITKKEKEIEKRKELAEQMSQSESLKQKNQLKENKIDAKIQKEQTTLESRRDYFHREIKAAYDKMEKTIQDAKDSFENYRTYCLGQIESLEKKTNANIELLEQSKESSSSVNDDKILKRLEIELKQLKEDHQRTWALYDKENTALLKAKQQEYLNQLQMEQEKLRMEENRKRELALQERRIQQQEDERKRQEKRERTRLEIHKIMMDYGCSQDEAQIIWMNQNNNPISKEDILLKRRQNIAKRRSEIRKLHPEFKYVIDELDDEYSAKLIRQSDDQILPFLTKMKPLIDLKVAFDKDETLLDDDHTQIYMEKLTLDQQLECIKLKTKKQRYKYLDSFQKLRSEEWNDSLGMV